MLVLGMLVSSNWAFTGVQVRGLLQQLMSTGPGSGFSTMSRGYDTSGVVSSMSSYSSPALTDLLWVDQDPDPAKSSVRISPSSDARFLTTAVPAGLLALSALALLWRHRVLLLVVPVGFALLGCAQLAASYTILGPVFHLSPGDALSAKLVVALIGLASVVLLVTAVWALLIRRRWRWALQALDRASSVRGKKHPKGRPPVTPPDVEEHSGQAIKAEGADEPQGKRLSSGSRHDRVIGVACVVGLAVHVLGLMGPRASESLPWLLARLGNFDTIVRATYWVEVRPSGGEFRSALGKLQAPRPLPDMVSPFIAFGAVATPPSPWTGTHGADSGETTICLMGNVLGETLLAIKQIIGSDPLPLIEASALGTEEPVRIGANVILEVWGHHRMALT